VEDYLMACPLCPSFLVYSASIILIGFAVGSAL
jgi:hypothetical protein